MRSVLPRDWLLCSFLVDNDDEEAVNTNYLRNTRAYFLLRIAGTRTYISPSLHRDLHMPHHPTQPILTPLTFLASHHKANP